MRGTLKTDNFGTWMCFVIIFCLAEVFSIVSSRDSKLFARKDVLSTREFVSKINLMFVLSGFTLILKAFNLHGKSWNVAFLVVDGNLCQLRETDEITNSVETGKWFKLGKDVVPSKHSLWVLISSSGWNYFLSVFHVKNRN